MAALRMMSASDWTLNGGRASNSCHWGGGGNGSDSIIRATPERS